MQKTIRIITLAILVLCFQHCRKSTLNDQSGFSNFQKVSLRDSAQAWLSNQKSNRPNIPFIDTIQQKISWDSLSVIIDVYHEQKILYVPVNYNNNHTGLVFTVDDQTTSVTEGYFMEIPSDYSAAAPVQFLSTFYLHSNNSLTAKITVYDLSNSFSYGLGYEKGEYKYKKIPEKVGINNNRSSNTDQANSRFDCVEYYLVTYYSDGSQDREYLGTVCNNCEQTRILSNEGKNSYSLKCDIGGNSSGGGSGSASSSKTAYTNKPLAVPTAATASISRLPNGKFQATVNNNGLFLFSTLTINYTFDLVKKTLDENSVTTNIGSGIFVGTWKQTGVTNVYSDGDYMYFTITATVNVGVPDSYFSVITPYIITVKHYLPLNTVFLDNRQANLSPHKSENP